MIFISEWLPNPAGSDASGEWVELYNSGPAAANLASYRLQTTTAKKIYSLPEVEIGAGEYFILKRTDTKISLSNTNAGLRLIDADGNVVQEVAFRGLAQEGKSANVGTGASAYFALPTPSAVNAKPQTASVVDHGYTFGVPLVSPQPFSSPLLVCLGAGVLFAAAVIFIFKRNNDLSELFFSRY